MVTRLRPQPYEGSTNPIFCLKTSTPDGLLLRESWVIFVRLSDKRLCARGNSVAAVISADSPPTGHSWPSSSRSVPTQVRGRGQPCEHRGPPPPLACARCRRARPPSGGSQPP